MVDSLGVATEDPLIVEAEAIDVALLLASSSEVPSELAATVIQRARDEGVWLHVAEEAARLRFAAHTRTLQDISSSILERELTGREVRRLEEFLDRIAEEGSE